MIRVTIEHISNDGSEPRVLGIAEISETGELGAQTGGRLSSHQVRILKPGSKARELLKHTLVDRFDSRRRGAWDLLYLGLRSLFGARNGESYRQTSFDFSSPPESDSLMVETSPLEEPAQAA